MGTRRIASLIAGLGLIITTIVPALASRTVIFVPGVMGSRLCDKNTGAVVWGDSKSYLKERLERIRLRPEDTLATTKLKPCGIIREVVIIPYVWEQTFYTPVIDALKSFRGAAQVVEFDYDWRFSNRENARELSRVIEGKVRAGEKVDIVAHSMGGLVARIYIQELGGADRTHSLVTMGTPHRGSAMLFQRLKEGLDNWPDRWAGGLALIQSTILSFHSAYEMLPAYSDCCAFVRKGRPEYFNVYDPSAWEKFLWLPNELRDGAGKRFLANQLSRAAEIAVMMRSPIFPSANAKPVTTIASAKLATWSRVFFDNDTGEILEPVKRPGDGTVSLYSASNSAIVSAPSFNEHSNVFVGEAPIETLRRVLADIEWTSTEVNGTHEFKDGAGVALAVSLIEVLPNQRLFAPGEKGTVSVSLQGGDALSSADLSVIQASFIPGGSSLTRSADSVHAAGDAKKRTITFDLVAPSREEPFVVGIRIPGLERLDVVLLSEATR